MKCMFYEQGCNNEISLIKWLIFGFGMFAMCKECKREFLK